MTIRWKTREDVQHFDDNIQYVIQWGAYFTTVLNIKGHSVIDVLHDIWDTSWWVGWRWHTLFTQEKRIQSYYKFPWHTQAGWRMGRVGTHTTKGFLITYCKISEIQVDGWGGGGIYYSPKKSTLIQWWIY
jgi:hypothetical protein